MGDKKIGDPVIRQSIEGEGPPPNCDECGADWKYHEGTGEDTECPDLNAVLEQNDELETKITAKDARIAELKAQSEALAASEAWARAALDAAKITIFKSPEPIDPGDIELRVTALELINGMPNLSDAPAIVRQMKARERLIKCALAVAHDFDIEGETGRDKGQELQLAAQDYREASRLDGQEG